MIRIERRRNGLSEPEVRPVCNENVRQKNHWLELLPGENRWKTLYGIYVPMQRKRSAVRSQTIKNGRFVGGTFGLVLA